MVKQLNIRSDEAFERARRLARERGLTTTELVVRALRRMENEAGMAAPIHALSPDLAKDDAHFAELARKARHEMGDRATSKHDEFYDDLGLPK